ncbi:MAG: hypothetical protein ACJZ6A_07070 [Candidatus Poseidoniaceae archaeon]
MQKSVRSPVLISCLLAATMLSVILFPILTQNPNLEESMDDLRSGEGSAWTLSPTTGPHTGGTSLTLTTTGLSSYFEESNWENFTIDSSADVGKFSSIVADSNGELHISYRDSTNGHLKYASNAGGTWTSYPIDNGGGYIGRYTSIDVDSNDKVHISYGNLNSWDLKYATNVAGSWSRSTIDDGGTGQAGMYSSLVIDSNDLIHVSYWGRSFDLKYATKSATAGGTWADEIVQWGYMTGEWTSIALDSNDKPFFSHCDETYDRLELGYKSGSSWTTPTIDSGSSGEIDNGTSLAIDSNDAKHIVYYDDDNGDLRYADYNTQTNLWQNTILDSNGDVGKYPSIEIDSQDNLHVAYYDNGNQKLKYAYHDGTSWNFSTLDESGGMYPSVTIDSNDNIYISYYDDTNSNLKVIQNIVNSNDPLGEVSIEFVGYGNVTGTVLDDETITFSSPPGNIDGEVVDLAIWLENGTKINLPVSFEYETYDSDGDGIPNTSDDCPQTYGDSTIDQTGCPDSDGDGYSNSGDAFPNDSSQFSDYDNDGCGDNPTGVNADEFPYDTTQCTDYDSDGYGDNLSGNNPDHFPSDSSQWNDTDGDGFGDNPLGNNSDNCPSEAGNSTMPGLGCLDSDGDGYANTFDAFPFDASETHDTDSDGVGDNSDAFPVNGMEQFDADGDGVGDNADAFPNDANETNDRDGDGVGDNSDTFPDDANESTDSDGDGIGDNADEYPLVDNFIDSDNDGILDLEDAFPSDATQTNDSDGDGYGDNASGNNPDQFTNVSTQWADTDGDGYGDNWGNSSWNSTRVIDFPGEFVEGAELADHCPTVSGNSTADGIFGCPDGDGDGIADQYDDVNGSAVIEEEPEQEPEQETQDESNSEEESYLDSLFSGNTETITQTAGFGAILLAVLALLQTNLVAGLLPDAFRWVQVLRRNNKLSKEEIKELNYLQSLVQAYYYDVGTLFEELEQLRSDLTGRYTNNEINKKTREKIVTLIEDLQTMDSSQISGIANSEAYFGLADTADVEERTELLEQELAMRADENIVESAPVAGMHPDASLIGKISPEDGHEYLEYPSQSGVWYLRNQTTRLWDKWE